METENTNGKTYFADPIVGVASLSQISQGAEAVSSKASANL